MKNQIFISYAWGGESEEIAQKYIISFLLACTIVGILLIPFFVRLYYSFRKSGLVWSIREGIPVNVFASRNKISTISDYWSYVTVIKAGMNKN